MNRLLWITPALFIGILVGLFLTGVPIFLAFMIMIISGVVFMFGDAAFVGELDGLGG